VTSPAGTREVPGSHHDPLRELIATELSLQEILDAATVEAETIHTTARTASADIERGIDAELEAGRAARAARIRAECDARVAGLDLSSQAAVERLHHLSDAEIDRLADLVLERVLPAPEAGDRQ
jgi:hypothetical protein